MRGNTYYCTWSAGNTYSNFIGTNKSKMAKDARKIVKGNLTPESKGHFEIYISRDHDMNEMVASGTVRN
jgi:hypothetical protein